MHQHAAERAEERNERLSGGGVTFLGGEGQQADGDDISDLIATMHDTGFGEDPSWRRSRGSRDAVGRGNSKDSASGLATGSHAPA